MIDPHAKLVEALRDCAGGKSETLQSSSRPWASATFSGARHEIRLRLPIAVADVLNETLDQHQFTIRGHLVADILVAHRHDAGNVATIDIEALTIEQG